MPQGLPLTMVSQTSRFCPITVTPVSHLHLTEMEVTLQTQLLDINQANTEVDDNFLRMFADVVGTRWSFLASFLSHTAAEIEEMERQESSGLCVLQTWRDTTHPTIGHLLILLKASFLLPSFFHRIKSQFQLTRRHQVQVTGNLGKLLGNIPCIATPHRHAIHGLILSHTESKVFKISLSGSAVHSAHIDSRGRSIVWEDIGLSISVPPGAVHSVRIAVCCSQSTPFTLSRGLKLVSPVFLIVLSPETKFDQQVQLSVNHSANEKSCSQLTFVSVQQLARHSAEPESSRHLAPIANGEFTLKPSVGRISLDHIPPVIAVAQCRLSATPVEGWF